jgi:hypothetical protein
LLTIGHVIAFGIHWRAWAAKVRSVTSTFSEKSGMGSVLVPARAVDGADADALALRLMSGPTPEGDIRTDY